MFPTSLADDRARMAQLDGAGATGGYLMRSASSSLGETPAAARGVWPRARALLPDVTVGWNSALATPENDGALWRGRGAYALVRAGALVETGRLRLLFAPELAVAQNRTFEVLPSNTPGRSVFASPWHTGRSFGDASMDLPLRFGDARRVVLGPGQSAAVLTVRGAEVGVASENEWWGPGVRNAIVLSDAAPGFPHAFVRTARPLRTRLGVVDARLLAGALVRSTFFDTADAGALRSISAAAVTLAPAVFPALTVGIERSVVRTSPRGRDVAAHALDVLSIWEGATTPADEERRASGQPTGRRADQLTGLMARLVAPSGGAEVYAEWVLQELPRSLHEFMVAPQSNQGYTLGLQWLDPRRERPVRARVQAELTDLEQSLALHGVMPRDFYSGFATTEGYTNRGQPLGAATGPGSSSQFVALDAVARTWQAGLFASRVRWENDALYRQPLATFYRHDVSLIGGARGAVRTRRLDASLELTYGTRINYLFQNGFNNPGGIRTVDVHNVGATLTLTPR